ncbi:MAG: RHS repeat domain-containing protein [Cyclobacteriaceae bacterium]
MLNGAEKFFDESCIGKVFCWLESGAGKYRYGYQGQFAEHDDETNWNHFELREYDAVIGRWLVPDPMRQHSSPYLSMSNNPVNSVDPDGGLDWYQNNETGDLQWINGSAEVAGFTHLGEDLMFEFSSFIDRASFDGMYGLKDFMDFSGEKLYSWVNMDFTQDAAGNLVGSPTVTMGSEVMKTFGLIKGSPYPGMPEIGTSTVNGQSFSVNLEKHTMVNWFLEAPTFPLMGYNVVNVAQRLEITGQNGSINYKAFTDIFPSASLSINGTRVMKYMQPSFQKTHGLFSRPSPNLYQRSGNRDY